jgi:hypothetical protein
MNEGQSLNYCSGGTCDNLGVFKCSKCKSRRYCSKDCQLKEWSQHKLSCYQLVKPFRRTEWTCRRLDPLRQCYNPCENNIKEEIIKLFSLRRSSFFHLAKALEIYALMFTKTNFNEKLDNMRKGEDYDENETLASTISLVSVDNDEISTQYTESLYIFWSMVLEDNIRPSFSKEHRLETHALVAMGLFYCSEMKRRQESNSILCLSFAPMTGEKYVAGLIRGNALRDMWLSDKMSVRHHNLVYLIYINDCSQTKEERANSMDKNLEEEEDNLPLKNDNPEHIFLIRIVNNEVFIFQSFEFYYSASEWLDYTKELVVQPKMKEEEWHKQVIKQPKYRRPFGFKKMDKLVKDIESLAKENPDPQKYADITGIVFEKLPSLKVMFCRYCVS